MNFKVVILANYYSLYFKGLSISIHEKIPSDFDVLEYLEETLGFRGSFDYEDPLVYSITDTERLKSIIGTFKSPLKFLKDPLYSKLALLLLKYPKESIEIFHCTAPEGYIKVSFEIFVKLLENTPIG